MTELQIGHTTIEIPEPHKSPLGHTKQESRIGGINIPNITGDASNCGIPDVYGNIAYFNKLCINNQPSDTNQSTRTILAETDLPPSLVQTQPNQWTILNQGWGTGTGAQLVNSDKTVFNLTQNGIDILFTGTYLIMIITDWRIGLVTGETLRQIELRQGNDQKVDYFIYTNQTRGAYDVMTLFYPLYQGLGPVNISVWHDGTQQLASPAVRIRLILLGTVVS